MEKIVIIGVEPLQGTIEISGSKNASLPLMAASILTDEAIVLKNIPNLADIHTMGSVLESLGVNCNKSDLINKNIIQGIKKEPAPFSPLFKAIILGNLHIFPVPTATPIAEIKKVNLDENLLSSL